MDRSTKGAYFLKLRHACQVILSPTIVPRKYDHVGNVFIIN
jgi:hypothetical protein